MFAIRTSQVILLFTFLFSQLATAETDLSPAYFSQTAAITFNAPKAVAVNVRLPPWTYLASNNRLADLRVFNAEGVAVAHQLSALLENIPGAEFSVDAISIPVDADINEVVGHSTDIRLDNKGTVAIHMSEYPADPKATTQSKITQWLLDDPKLSSTAINNFRFELDEAHKTDFEAEVTVESSEDLRSWQPQVSNQKLLVYYGSHRLAQLNITFPATQSRYWRIRSNGADLGRISKIYVNSPVQVTQVNESLTVDCQMTPTKERIICPLNGAQIPITSLKFDFGNQRVAFNAMIRTYQRSTQLEEKTSKQRPSQELNSILTSSETPIIILNGLPISELELMTPKGDQLGLSSAPKLTVQWPAQQLRFLAHGSTPFILAVGADQLMNQSEQFIDAKLPTATGTIAEPIRQEPQAFPVLLKKRPWLLWLLLGTAVLILGSMAITLLKER